MDVEHCVQASAAAGMSTCESPWYLCLGGGVYQDISQASIASMCNYRWSWEDCCSRRVSREDLEVVIRNVLKLYDTLKYGDAHEKFNFLKIEDLRTFARNLSSR